jgi:P2-related tail formation protein
MIWNAPLLDPMRCDARFLQALGKFYGIEYWWVDLTEAEQRDFIMRMPLIKKRRGTLWAVRQVINVIDVNAQVIEGNFSNLRNGATTRGGLSQHGYLSHWAEFVVIASRAMTNAQATQMRRLIESVAPVRSRLIRIDFRNVANKHDGITLRNGNYNRGGA